MVCVRETTNNRFPELSETILEEEEEEEEEDATCSGFYFRARGEGGKGGGDIDASLGVFGGGRSDRLSLPLPPLPIGVQGRLKEGDRLKKEEE